MSETRKIMVYEYVHCPFCGDTQITLTRESFNYKAGFWGALLFQRGMDFIAESWIPVDRRTLEFWLSAFAHVVWRDNDRDVLYAHRRSEIEDVLNRIVADWHAPDCNRLAVDHDVSAKVRAPVRFRARPVRCVRICHLERKIVA